MTILKRSVKAKATTKDAITKLTATAKASAENQRARIAALSSLGFDINEEPTVESMAKRGIHALTTVIDSAIASIISGSVEFKTGEGAVTSMVQAIKLRNELVTQAGLNGQGNTDVDLTDEDERVRKATSEIVSISTRQGKRNPRKVPNRS